MRQKKSGYFAFLALLLSIAWALPACSASGPGDQDPRDVKVELTTDPGQAQAGKETMLLADVTGLLEEKKAVVQFEIRRADNKSLPELVEQTSYEGNGRFSAAYTFKERTKYDVYIHIYKGELHVTKKRPVDVGS